jgi:hypothetical protein
MTKRQEYMIIIEVCRKFHKQVYFVYNNKIIVFSQFIILLYYIIIYYLSFFYILWNISQRILLQLKKNLSLATKQ